VLTLNTMEAITSDALFLKCTSLAVGSEVTESGAGVIVAHNEDWLPEDKPCVYVARSSRMTSRRSWRCLMRMLPNLGSTLRAWRMWPIRSIQRREAGHPRIMYTRAIWDLVHWASHSGRNPSPPRCRL